MSALDNPRLFFHLSPPLRQPVFWIAGVGVSLLLVGLLAVALPESLSGPVVWTLDTDHSLHLADVIGSALLVAGSALTWIIILIWQWQQTH